MKNQKTNLFAVAMALGLATLLGCNNDDGTSNPLLSGWYDVYGNQCATGGNPSPGCNYYKKQNGESWKIHFRSDPFYTETCSTDDFGSTSCYDTVEYLHRNIEYVVNGVTHSYSGQVWISPTGIIYDWLGNALNAPVSGRGRDIVGDVATQENEIVSKAAYEFSMRHGIALEKATQIARNLNNYAKIGMTRSRTEDDMREFTEKLYGISYDQAKSAALEAQDGNLEKLNELIAEAAKNWGIGEEHMREIARSWYRF